MQLVEEIVFENGENRFFARNGEPYEKNETVSQILHSRPLPAAGPPASPVRLFGGEGQRPQPERGGKI